MSWKYFFNLLFFGGMVGSLITMSLIVIQSYFTGWSIKLSTNNYGEGYTELFLSVFFLVLLLFYLKKIIDFDKMQKLVSFLKEW